MQARWREAALDATPDDVSSNFQIVSAVSLRKDIYSGLFT